VRAVQVKIFLPEWFYRLGVWALLCYRRIRYGYAFRKIPLTQGKFAIVDQQDYERIAKYKWHVAKHGRSYYAQRGTGSAKSGKRKKHLVMMHREILRVGDDLLVDHKNQNSLDNRQVNLRAARWEENCWNKRKPNGHSSSRYKGVMWDKRRGKWQAQIGYKGKKIFLGYFDDEKEAATAYDKAAKLLFGEYAAPNLPSESQG
jgi:hypothetical protein